METSFEVDSKKQRVQKPRPGLGSSTSHQQPILRFQFNGPVELG